MGKDDEKRDSNTSEEIAERAREALLNSGYSGGELGAGLDDFMRRWEKED